MLKSKYLILAVVLTACTTATDVTTNQQTSQTAPLPTTTAAANPLTAEWTGPHGGVPPFDKVRVDDFRPALQSAISDNLANVDRIANNPTLPTFANTIEELERASRMYERVDAFYGIWSNNMATEDFQAVELEMEPKIAAYRDQITQNEKLFRRIETVYNSPAKASLTPEQQRLVWDYYTDFVRAGARLDTTKKARGPDRQFGENQ